MNKIIASLVILALSLPVCAVEEENNSALEPQTPALEEVTDEKITEEGLNTLQQKQEEQLAPAPQKNLQKIYKEPVSKKKLAKKFIVAMLCVVGTAIFLFVALSLYNRIRDGIMSASTPIPPEGERPLDTPQDLTEAVQTFVEKTKWEG